MVRPKLNGSAKGIFSKRKQSSQKNNIFSDQKSLLERLFSKESTWKNLLGRISSKRVLSKGVLSKRVLSKRVLSKRVLSKRVLSREFSQKSLLKGIYSKESNLLGRVFLKERNPFVASNSILVYIWLTWCICITLGLQ